MKNGLHIDEEGTKRYYLNDLLHRDDGPAEEWLDGDKFWYVAGNLHRENGPAAEWVRGNKFWYQNGEIHRVDGPALEYLDGDKLWYLNGKQHRADGPAEEWAHGDKDWYLHGVKLIHPKEFENMEEWFQYLNNNEEYSLQWINDINGMYGFIKHPSAKQTRLNAMRWKI